MGRTISPARRRVKQRTSSLYIFSNSSQIGFLCLHRVNSTEKMKNEILLNQVWLFSRENQRATKLLQELYSTLILHLGKNQKCLSNCVFVIASARWVRRRWKVWKTTIDQNRLKSTTTMNILKRTVAPKSLQCIITIAMLKTTIAPNHNNSSLQSLSLI